MIERPAQDTKTVVSTERLAEGEIEIFSVIQSEREIASETIG
jgi:hypothetical protein